MTDDTLDTAARPHVRSGSIAWGLILIATASLVLWVCGSAERRDAVVDWALALTPGGIAIVAVLALGGVLVLAGVLAAIRRAQRRTT